MNCCSVTACRGGSLRMRMCFICPSRAPYRKKAGSSGRFAQKMKRLCGFPFRIWADLNNLSAETHCINRRTKHSVSLPSERRVSIVEGGWDALSGRLVQIFYPDWAVYHRRRSHGSAGRTDGSADSALGMSGIGGKISSGYGPFTVEERIDLLRAV